MPEPDAFDPTHALDGWRPPAPAPVQELDLGALLHPEPDPARPRLVHAGAGGFDPTHLLDGWRPPAPAPLDLELKSLLRVGTVPDEAKRARLKARGYEMLDVEDVELVEAPPLPRVVVEDWGQPGPMAPPSVEADLAPASPDEVVVQAEEAVDLPLSDEGVWPLFVEEAQLLDADAAVGSDRAATEFEPEPAHAAEMPIPGPEVELVAAVEPEPAPTVVAEVPDSAEPPGAHIEPDAEVQASAPETLAMAEQSQPESDVVPEPGPAVDLQAAEPVGEQAEHEPEPAAVVEASEPQVLEIHASPPPAPRFIDDIQLPSVPPPAVFEAPVLDFRAAPPPPEPDPRSVIAGIELPEVVPPPIAVEAPEIDMAALSPQPPPPDPRLLAHWQAGAWTALARQVAAASEELTQTSDGLRVDSRAPQWLCAVWPPQRADGALDRWPEMAALVAAETTAEALQQLLIELPDEAALWSADLEADWDLVAELVLHQDAALRPAQARALRELAEAERSARLLRFNEGYALHGGVARRRA